MITPMIACSEAEHVPTFFPQGVVAPKALPQVRNNHFIDTPPHPTHIPRGLRHQRPQGSPRYGRTDPTLNQSRTAIAS
jgi:hypothetical protein